ncbi:hypothetical protein AB0M46_44380 [Dactylosporangium sp. NPDC051485]
MHDDDPLDAPQVLREYAFLGDGRRGALIGPGVRCGLRRPPRRVRGDPGR